MTRIKAAAQRAPQTIDAATVLCARFAALDTEVAIEQAAVAESINIAKERGARALIPLVAELKDIAKQLKPWWEASAEAVTGGKRKSIELGGCDIGTRTTPPKLTFAHGKDEDGVAALQAASLARMTRTVASLDKPALLKVLGSDSEEDVELAELLRDAGFDVSQKEEFFVARSGKPIDVADVPA
jgi:phage host-nuclease inhibitor protein Gam